MQRALFEGQFFQTYDFANAITNILRDQFSYLRLLDEFYGGEISAFIHPFPRYSALHNFIEFIIDRIIDDEISYIKLDIRQDILSNRSEFLDDVLEKAGELHPSVLPINEALTYYGIEHISFQDWLKEYGKDFMQAGDDDVSDYYDDLRLGGAFEVMLEKAVQEVFFVLFQNRKLLLLFNEVMARQISAAGQDDEGRFASDGVLKRVNIPAWVRRAVYYRDRGLCTICHRDLSGELNVSNREHFDHIVPLAQGGLNDVSNIQLLCEDCNRKKSGVEIRTSDYYEFWYPMKS